MHILETGKIFFFFFLIEAIIKIGKLPTEYWRLFTEEDTSKKKIINKWKTEKSFSGISGTARQPGF